MKMSQRDLAAKLGYSDHTTLTRIEADKVNLSESRIKQISNALDVSMSHLMGWDEKPEEVGKYAANVLKDLGLQKTLQNFLALSKKDQKLVSSLIESLAEKEKDQSKD
jgi:transcriptional regulator with XRE-family HTH domain